MILEGIVTTIGPDGGMHVAAMGPHVADPPSDRTAGTPARIERLLLRPFATSQTGANLLAVPEGVFHLTDDALLLARVVTGTLTAEPASRPASSVRGRVLADACRAYEFRIETIDRSQERLRLEARVVAEHAGRPFLGFNRARHAVVEGAILVTRLHLLGAAEVMRQLQDLAVLVEKTGGPAEHAAFRLLEERAAAGDVRAPHGPGG